MIVSDWRELPVESAAHLYRRERARWQRRLAWDTTDTWTTVETARVTWGLPGLVCREPGGPVAGWTFYLPRDGSMDVGGFCADTEAATAALVEALAARARGFARLSGFFYSAAPGLHEALERQGIDVARFLYLVNEFDGPTLVPSDHSPELPITGWTGADLEAAADLLGRAYGASGRIYARHNEPGEWREYAGNLVADSACGRFSPALSRAIVSAGRLGAVAMVTEVSRSTAHVAQIAVDPSLRRRGLAKALVCDVLGSARRAGFARVSLLVSTGNTAARELYRTLGFTARDEFAALDAPAPGLTLSGSRAQERPAPA